MKVLPYKKNLANQFAVVRIHYSVDPGKDADWVKQAKQGMPENGWKREYEIDYSSYAGKPYYPEFREYNISKQSIEYAEREVLYRGWDYGFHRPCCIITKLDQRDRWCWLKVILGKDEGILDFGKRVNNYCHSTFPGARYIDADDIAGNQVSDKSEKTSRQLLNTLGVYPRARRQEIRQGGELIRKKLLMRADGQPGLLIDPTQTMFIDGFKGGLHYPDVFDNKGSLLEGKREPQHYEKDGFYDHIFDAARYIAVEMFSLVGEVETTNRIAVDRSSLEYQYRDGRGEGEANNLDGFGQDMKEFFG